MKALDLIKEESTKHSIEETFYFVDVSFSFQSYVTRPIDLAKDLFQQIQSRDSVSINIDIGGTDTNIESIDSFDDCYKLFEDFKEDSGEIEEIKVSISITKKFLNNTVSIYSLHDFCQHLKLDYLLSTLTTVGKIISSAPCLVFSCLDEDICFGSETIRFISSTLHEGICNFDRTALSHRHKEHILDTNCPLNLFPKDFLKISEPSTPCPYIEIITFFDEARAALSLSNISNSFLLKKDNTFTLTISGYKNNTIELQDIENFTDSETLKSLFRIQNWVFSDGETIDKIQLARNIISLYVENGQLCFNREVFLAIQSNYNIYLQENVTTYIEVKNKITEIIIQSSVKNSELCDSFLSYFRGNCLALLTFFLSAFFLKSVDSEAAYTSNLLILSMSSFVLIILSFVWLEFIRNDLTSRFQHNKKLLETTIKTNYKNILLTTEIDGLLNSTEDENETFFLTAIGRYSKIWKTTSLTLVGLYLVILWALAGWSLPTSITTSPPKPIAPAHSTPIPVKKPVAPATTSPGSSQDPDIPASTTPRSPQKTVTPASTTPSSSQKPVVSPTTTQSSPQKTVAPTPSTSDSSQKSTAPASTTPSSSQKPAVSPVTTQSSPQKTAASTSSNQKDT